MTDDDDDDVGESRKGKTAHTHTNRFSVLLLLLRTHFPPGKTTAAVGFFFGTREYEIQTQIRGYKIRLQRAQKKKKMKPLSPGRETAGILCATFSCRTTHHTTR